MPASRWTRQQLDEGVLDAEQHLEWRAPWPTTQARLEALAEAVERQHLLSIERFTLRVLRARREGTRLTCRLPSGHVALGFADEARQVTEERVCLRWAIDPSFMARRALAAQGSASTYGRLEIGVERRLGSPANEGEGEGGESGVSSGRADGKFLERIHGWVAVTAFPSRFLTPLPRRIRRLDVLWRPVGRAYALFHAQASFSCLGGVARAMHSEAG